MIESSAAVKNGILRSIYQSRTNKNLAAALKRLKESQNLKTVLELSGDRRARVRREAAKKLQGWISDGSACEALLKMLSDQDEQVRWFAALSLGERDPQENLPQLRILLSTHQPEKWMHASIMMRKEIPQELRLKIIAGLEASEEIRNLAVSLLGRIEEIDLIKRSANDSSPAVRDTVISILLQAGETGSLYCFSRDVDPFIRQRIGQIYGKRILSRHPVQTEICQAALIGEATGDALGAPVEFSSLDDIRTIGGVEEYLQDPARPLLPGDYTDDAQMPLMLAKSIIRSGRVDPSEAAREFASFCLALDLGRVKNRGYSNSTLTSYRKLYAGLNWRLASKASNGCGPATTVVPLGLIIENPETLINNVRGVALITKTGGEALAGALATAYLIHQIHWRQLPSSPSEIIENTARFVEKTSAAMAFEIRRLKSLLPLSTGEALNQIPHNADGRKTKTGMKALGVVPSAIYCFVKTLTDLRQTILSAVHTQGDSDSIAAIAGAISAAHNGLSAMPAEWKAGLTGYGEITEIAEKLAKC